MSFQKEKLKKTLMASLFIHLVIGAVLLVGYQLKQTHSKSIQIISLDVKKKTKKRVHKKVKKQTKPQIQISSKGQLSSFSKVILTGKDGYEIQKEISIETDSLIYPFLKRLHDKISNSISYPEKLVKKKESGIITAQFDIDARGKMLGEPDVSYSENSKLSQHLIRSLKATLKKPLDPHSKLPVKKIRIVTRFDFQVVSHEEIFPKNQPQVVKNVLHFYKYAARNHSVIQAGAKGSSSGILSIDPFELLEAERESNL